MSVVSTFSVEPASWRARPRSRRARRPDHARGQRGRQPATARLDLDAAHDRRAARASPLGPSRSAIVQPNGIWEVGPVLRRRSSPRFGSTAAPVSSCCSPAVAPFAIASLIKGHDGTALSVSLGVVPWFLVMRLLRGCASSATRSTPRARPRRAPPPAAERGRLAREMHDVLAHSLSALALQLETTRLLARERGADDDVTRAIDQAHHLAASGLDDARRAIAAARGDELPGPERIGALADAFGEQSGLPVVVEVQRRAARAGARRPPGRVPHRPGGADQRPPPRRRPSASRCSLAYLPDRTVLVVEDHARPGDAAAGRARDDRRRLRPHRDARARRAARRRAAGGADAPTASASSYGCRHDGRRPPGPRAARRRPAARAREPRRRCSALLGGIELVGTASDGEEAVALAGRAPPGRRADGSADAARRRDRGDPAAARAACPRSG